MATIQTFARRPNQCQLTDKEVIKLVFRLDLGDETVVKQLTEAAAERGFTGELNENLVNELLHHCGWRVHLR